MIILAVDTSTLAGSVALVQDDKLLGEVILDLPRKHTERLQPSIEYLLKEINIGPQDIDLLAVGLGPGSFTGLRIGLAFIKGLSLSLDKPVLGIGSLDAMARGFYYSSLPVCPVIDARKQQVFAALYEPTASGTMKKLTDDLVLNPDALCRMIQGPVLFAGDGAGIYAELFKERLGGLAAFAPPGFDSPRAVHIATLARERYLRNETDDAFQIVPRYVRLSDAELKLVRKDDANK